MTKRAKIALGSPSIMRISPIGVDVDAASPSQLLLDERVFSGQLYAAGYIANPSPGTAGSVTATFPSIGFVPLCTTYYVYGSQIVHPSFYTYLVGGNTLIVNTQWTATASSITVNFGAGTGYAGAYYLVFRIPQ